MWSNITTELMAGAGSLGAYLDREHLALVHIQKGFSAPQVVHTAQWPLPENGLEALAPEIAAALADWGVQGTPVSLAVSPQLGFMRQVTLPAAARDNLAKVIGYEIDRFLPLGADKLVYDYQIASQTETEITLTLMALPRELIEQWLNLCEAAALQPITVELAATAAANTFALLGGRLPGSWLLLRVGETGYELMHIQNQAVRSWHSGRVTPGEGFLEDIAGEVTRLRAAGAKPGTLCLYGPGAGRVRPSAVMERLSLPVIRETQLNIAGLDFEAGASAPFLPALGAAWRGVGKVPVKTNLLSESDRVVVKLTGLFLTRVLLVLLLSLSVIWMGSIFLHKKISLMRAENRLAELQPAVRQVEDKLNETQELGKQLQNVQKRVEQYPSTLVIMRELTRIIPEHTYLYSLRFKKDQIEIGGRSSSAADLISILEKSGLFTKTEFVSPIVTDETGSEIFKIKAEIKGVVRGS
ncbi:MAG: PilN domain-containing protein [Deltaproteobacteria bacterium]|nr:PilN domain-containing protein [Deltaproteobacteria bacterium]